MFCEHERVALITKTLQIKQQERFAMHFEACFVMLSLTCFFSPLPSLRARSTKQRTENNNYTHTHLQSHTLIINIIIFCGTRTSVWPPQNVRENNLSVCVAQLMNLSELDTLCAGQLSAITYTGNQSRSQPRNNSSWPVESRLVFPQSPNACGYSVLDFILGFACTISD